LRWKVNIFSGRGENLVNCLAGDVAGSVPSNNKLHSVVGLQDNQYLTHRVIYEMLFGELEDTDFIDHIDGNGWNNKSANLRKVSHALNMRNCKHREDNKTGVTGVCRYRNRHGGYNYTASWKWLDGSQGTKTFSVSKYGEGEAFRLACEYREKMIVELNSQGAGYTEDHGKRW
jgi:hypothetical protein